MRPADELGTDIISAGLTPADQCLWALDLCEVSLEFELVTGPVHQGTTGGPILETAGLTIIHRKIREVYVIRKLQIPSIYLLCCSIEVSKCVAVRQEEAPYGRERMGKARDRSFLQAASSSRRPWQGRFRLSRRLRAEAGGVLGG